MAGRGLSSLGEPTGQREQARPARYLVTDRSTPPDGEAALPVPETAVTPPRRRRRRVLIALLSALGVLGAVGLGIWFYADWQIERNIEWIDDPFAALPSRPPVSTPSTRDQPVTSTTAPGTSGTTEGPQDSSAVRRGDPVNLLFLGSDSRISAGDPSLWQAGAQRTDAIMLVHIPSHREEIFVMSIPRDSWVPVPGHGDAKINAAFSYGGPSLLVQTFEQLTGVRIDHLAVVDFASFVELTDMFLSLIHI